MTVDAVHPQFPFGLDLVLKRRLGRILLFCVLGAALVPSAVLGLAGYHLTERRLQQEIGRQAAGIAERKRHDLQTLFDRHRPRNEGPGDGDVVDALRADVERILGIGGNAQPGWRTYLLDVNLTLVAGDAGLQRREPGASIETDPARQWREHLAAGDADRSAPPPRLYAGPSGEPVLGTHAQIDLDRRPYLLVVEWDTDAAAEDRGRIRALWLVLTVLTAAGALAVGLVLAGRIVAPVDDLSRRLAQAAKGRFDDDGHLAVGHEIDNLASAVSGIIGRIKAVTAVCDAQSRFLDALAGLRRAVGGKHRLEDLCLNTLESLAAALDLVNSSFLTVDGDGKLACIGRFPGHPGDEPPPAGEPQDEPAARAIREKAIVFARRDAAGEPMTIVPRAGQANMMVVPLIVQERVEGLLKLERTNVFGRLECRFAEAAAAVAAAALDAAGSRRRESPGACRAPKPPDPLTAREAALRAQSRAFRIAEGKLQLKQLELEAANAQMMKNAADLEAHMAILQKQKKDMQKQNAELEKTHRELEEKARQLEMSSRYKTEFMANMSHELRTPLNSILLLSRLLLENKENTLTPKQSQFARTVHSAGEDLLNLINEILDLAKVESGKMEVELAPVAVRSVTSALLAGFAPLAEQKGIAFSIHVAPDVPEQVTTDRKRLEQIVKNFLSNAFKFTSRGSVRLEVAVFKDAGVEDPAADGGNGRHLALSVVDTGIGIPASKHRMVFEAFQQVDGSTRRKYGGTGLGLSISRELARILGGRISLQSEDGRGSRFTLHLPIVPPAEKKTAVIHSDVLGTSVVRTAAAPPPAAVEPEPSDTEPVPDDRHRLIPGEKAVLIIDAAPKTTEPIKTAAYRNGYKVLIAEQFPTGLHFADYYLPSVIFVNLELAEAGGWEMISRIKANPRNRHTPVFSMSPSADALPAAIHGAAGHVAVPSAAKDLERAFQRLEALDLKKAWQVLVVAPDSQNAAAIAEAVTLPDLRTRIAENAGRAAEILGSEDFDAVIVHPSTAAEVQAAILGSLHRNPMPLYHFSGTPWATSSPGGAGPSDAPATPRRIDTPDQLLLALVADLHLPAGALDKASRDRLRAMDGHHNMLKGRNILLVDDDMRTVFAVSNALEDQGAAVLTGKTGKESLDKMDGFPDIDLILMDVMISDVDGYQAIRDIRNRDRYKNLPIIALTARAMQGDRAKCIRAGANDYLAKPVNLDKLTSMLKIWLEPQRMASAASADASPG
ncbi:MAG TPA: response regulator [Desulfosarcina sp.]|nr:response regulator [Desulfosarcina sp.]